MEELVKAFSGGGAVDAAAGTAGAAVDGAGVEGVVLFCEDEAGSVV
jgi:hypothetical protein